VLRSISTNEAPGLRRHRKRGPVAARSRRNPSPPDAERVEAKVSGGRDVLPVVQHGTLFDVAIIVWCSGFRRDGSWVELPIFDDSGLARTAPREV
jgi:putative flavoprotein involved in K+ transport